MDRNAPTKNLKRITSIVCISAIALTSLRIFYHLLLGTKGFLTVPQDDFYYYLITAKHIVHQGISSFDGISITNGYHPLWMLVVVVVESLSFGNETIFFILYGLICSLSAYISYRLVLKILREEFGDTSLIFGPTVLASISISWMAFWGMEITLAIPLFLYFFYKIQEIGIGTSRRKIIEIGFAASLLILSRLDSVIFVVLSLLYLVFQNGISVRQTVKIVASFCLGALLVPIYLLYNYFAFGSFSTVSAQAKRLITHYAFDPKVFINIWSINDGMVACILTPIALLLLWSRRTSETNRKSLLSLVMVYPFFFLLIYRIFSDWYFFSWYGYAFPFANAVALSIILVAICENYLSKKSALCGYISLGAISTFLLATLIIRTVGGTINWNPHPGSILAHAQKLKEFSDSHPGVYAMGDRAGLTAYLLDKPVVQIEGIISDQKMVDHIAHEDDMTKVMNEYGVNYAIFSIYAPMKISGSSYSVEMPLKDLAGERSKRMKGSFSQEPVFYYQSPDYPRIYTYIFKLN